jgi:hypothetical protein
MEFLMKNIRVVFAPAVLAFCLLLGIATGTAFAAAKKTPPPPPDMRKVIQSVDAKNSAVVIVYMESKQTHNYRIDDMTALKVNGVPGKLGDIKKGMVVTDYPERDNDDLDGLTLTGYGEEPAAAKPAAKPKPKPKPAATAPSSQQ